MAGISVTFLSQTARLQLTVAQKSCHPQESQTPVFGQGRLAGAREGAVGSDLSHQEAFDLGIKHFPVFTRGGGGGGALCLQRQEMKLQIWAEPPVNVLEA